MAAPKKQPPVSGGEPAAQENTQHSNRSTATAAQEQRILDMLAGGRERHTLEFQRAGIMQLHARLNGLRKRGYEIHRVDLRDRFDPEGYRHVRVASYRLVSVPQGEQGAA